MDKPTRTRRHYTDDQRAEALAALDANGGNLLATAEVVRVSRKTLERWRNERGSRPELADLRQVKKEQLARGIEKLARRVLKRALRQAADEGERVSLRDSAVVLGICVDKLQQIRGETGAGGITVNVNQNAPSLTLTVEDIEAAKKLFTGQRQYVPIAPGGVPD